MCIRERGELEVTGAARVDQVTAQLGTGTSEAIASSEAVERIKAGFIHFKKEKYESVTSSINYITCSTFLKFVS